MSIRRQYSLPNCTLVLEGLSDSFGTNDATMGRPVLSILVNAECHFVGIPQKLQGGRTFVENLAKAVSAYAQEYLSGVPHPQEVVSEEDSIRLEKIPDTHLHRLTWQANPKTEQPPLELELTTVQLFDLVEGIDQFFADSQTLPDLTLQLRPLSRRYRVPDEPLVQRAVPATLGIVSLAIAGLALFFLPIPEVREPEPKPEVTPTQPVPNNTPVPPSGN
ncbi:conserved hypothetical protein [Rippkaea orientalis PCC 8801]|uniref:DUF4335 domain-containing protein n=1 Tax=Rippkaea orientalis (strain PCC 8801 / RF-1) TaxID=41431 RepID=B7JVC4_RIPO1|nr:DUF4335 domain-containing protein [Rippkaea orientalis]ACK68257.1 conserved hypothetical protein [Rippkaea orientalis PCC 8801]